MGDADFSTWAAAVYRLGGVPTTWPTQAGQGHVGEPAARFSPDTYTVAYNAGQLPDYEKSWTSDSGQSIYVLASDMTGGSTVVDTAPHIANYAERAANAAFTAMGQAADAVGLPSLAGVEQTLKLAGLVLAGLGVLAFLRRR